LFFLPEAIENKAQMIAHDEVHFDVEEPDLVAHHFVAQDSRPNFGVVGGIHMASERTSRVPEVQFGMDVHEVMVRNSGIIEHSIVIYMPGQLGIIFYLPILHRIGCKNCNIDQQNIHARIFVAGTCSYYFSLAWLTIFLCLQTCTQRIYIQCKRFWSLVQAHKKIEFLLA
jgi:hypothetical protein